MIFFVRKLIKFLVLKMRHQFVYFYSLKAVLVQRDNMYMAAALYEQENFMAITHLKSCS